MTKLTFTIDKARFANTVIAGKQHIKIEEKIFEGKVGNAQEIEM